MKYPAFDRLGVLKKTTGIENILPLLEKVVRPPRVTRGFVFFWISPLTIAEKFEDCGSREKTALRKWKRTVWVTAVVLALITGALGYLASPFDFVLELLLLMAMPVCVFLFMFLVFYFSLTKDYYLAPILEEKRLLDSQISLSLDRLEVLAIELEVSLERLLNIRSLEVLKETAENVVVRAVRRAFRAEQEFRQLPHNESTEAIESVVQETNQRKREANDKWHYLMLHGLITRDYDSYWQSVEDSEKKLAEKKPS